MTHEEIEALIFAEKPLPEPERALLEAHLCECRACAKLQQKRVQVDYLLAVEPLVRPRPGFETRFMERLGRDQKRRRLKGSVFLILMTLLGTGTAFLFNVSQMVIVFSRMTRSVHFWFERVVLFLGNWQQPLPYMVSLEEALPAAVVFPIVLSISGLLVSALLVSAFSLKSFLRPVIGLSS